MKLVVGSKMTFQGY